MGWQILKFAFLDQEINIEKIFCPRYIFAIQTFRYFNNGNFVPKTYIYLKGITFGSYSMHP